MPSPDAITMITPDAPLKRPDPSSPRAVKANTPLAFQGNEGHGRYEVSFKDKRVIVVAANRVEAWALFCDATFKGNVPPGPKTVGIRIEWLGPA